jgi:hypothetical protein
MGFGVDRLVLHVFVCFVLFVYACVTTYTHAEIELH